MCPTEREQTLVQICPTERERTLVKQCKTNMEYSVVDKLIVVDPINLQRKGNSDEGVYLEMCSNHCSHCVSLTLFEKKAISRSQLRNTSRITTIMW